MTTQDEKIKREREVPLQELVNQKIQEGKRRKEKGRHS